MAITMGDCNGIGPETVVKAVRQLQTEMEVCFLVIGDRRAFASEAEKQSMHEWAVLDDSTSRQPGTYVWQPPCSPILTPAPGRVTAEAAVAAVAWIQAAVDLCLSGSADAMITAPICKEGLLKAGLHMPGHTEYLAELTGSKHVAMMLMGEGLRVVPATRHIPLKDVAHTLNEACIVEAVQMASDALTWFDVPSKKVAVCGLNPHAGDGGALGDEEQTIVRPAIERALELGCDVTGPVPADVVFYQALRGDYGAVVAMYHDQGLAPLKLLAFDSGINITLGLPIIRTSPDHGTAFSIAGRGVASPASMLEAIRTAYRLTGRDNPWKRD